MRQLTLHLPCTVLQINDNNAWIAHFEANKDNGAFESQYKKLLSDIQEIYGTAKEFHGKGIDLLIKVRVAGPCHSRAARCLRVQGHQGQRPTGRPRRGGAAVGVWYIDTHGHANAVQLVRWQHA
jgi:hypothetical protein